MKIKAVAVFCGSKNGNNILYTEHAAQLGVILAKKQIDLIYGGGSKGLMGALADAMLHENGRVIGIIPTLLVEWEHQHKGITELTIVEDMHIRKKKMYELCDAAIILPGGFGTLDELFELVTWNQLSIHDKRIFILNSGGFYDTLLEHINKLRNEGFLYESPNNVFTIVDDPAELAQFF